MTENFKNNPVSDNNNPDFELLNILNEFSSNEKENSLLPEGFEDMLKRYGVGDEVIEDIEKAVKETQESKQDFIKRKEMLENKEDKTLPTQNKNPSQRIIYDADTTPETKSNSVPVVPFDLDMSLSSKNKKSTENNPDSGTRIIYDADGNFESTKEKIISKDANTVSSNYTESKTDTADSLASEKSLNSENDSIADLINEGETKPQDKSDWNELPDEEKKEVSGFTKFLKSFIPWKGDPVREIVRKIVMVASLCVIIYYGFYFVNYFRAMGMSVNDMNELAELATEPVTSQNTDLWEEIRSQYPNVAFPENMQPRWASLYALNNDFSGWISVPNTNIDVVVVQAKDNTEYLKKNYYGKNSKYGTPFLDFRNFPNGFETLDKNTVIYGHNMKDGLMFAQLEKYMTPDGFIESPIISYSTPNTTYYWKIYAAFVSNGTPNYDNGYLFNYIVPRFRSDEAFMEYITALDERKLYTTGVEMLPTDKILTLSTCSYEFDEARLAVVARLVREGESLDIDSSLITINPSPRYPQRWYDERKLENPYRNSYRWLP